MKKEVELIHPSASQSCGHRGKPAPELLKNQQNSSMAMAKLLSSVTRSSSLRKRAILGPVVAQRIVDSDDVTVTSFAPPSGRLNQGAACLASSASCRNFGSSDSATWKSSSFTSRKQVRRVHTGRIRSEQTSGGGNRRSLNIWIGRLAMLGFTAAVGAEISTGKGLLAIAGLPLLVPTPVLGLIALAGAVTAFGVFRSSERD